MNDDSRIVCVEWAPLAARRPRHAGSNARLSDHGLAVRLPLARLTAADGSTGFGLSDAGPAMAAAVLGRPLDELFAEDSGTADGARAYDCALWDLVARRRGLPVYRLAARMTGKDAAGPLEAPCYDTSLYFDDLHLASTAEAAQLLAEEAQQGHARGHQHFKIKVGRGARHLPLEEGTQRDIAIVHAVRRAIGPDGLLMLDANNGYNLNLARHVLSETAGCQIHWLEEAFHEDAVLYRELKGWLAGEGLKTLIADGEGQASPTLLDWARDGLVDVVQYDIFGYGFTRWLALGRQLDQWGARSAPHHYGRLFGNYAVAYLAAALASFTMVEWDEAQAPELDTSAYHIADGCVHVPDAPGFGLELDDDAFGYVVRQSGYSIAV